MCHLGQRRETNDIHPALKVVGKYSQKYKWRGNDGMWYIVVEGRNRADSSHFKLPLSPSQSPFVTQQNKWQKIQLLTFFRLITVFKGWINTERWRSRLAHSLVEGLQGHILSRTICSKQGEVDIRLLNIMLLDMNVKTPKYIIPACSSALKCM